MRVAVKNMSGVFIHPTTPRRARLLLKEKKAVIESNNPFTIRLLFSVGECELKDSESLNKSDSGLLPEKDITMCDARKETEELHNTFGDYIQPSLNVIMANPKNKRIKWCSKDINSANGENSPESFVQTLYDACTMLYQQTDGRYYGNFVHIGKRGFNLLQKLDPKRFWKMDNWVGIDDAIKVHYITTMPENNFIVSINNNYFKDRDKFIVGSIVDEECSEKSESEEAIKQQKQSDNNNSESDNNNSEKENIMSDGLHIPKTHLIFGAAGCGKTTLLAKLVRDKLNNGELVAHVIYNKNKDVHSKLFNAKNGVKLFNAENGASCTLVEIRGKDAFSPVEASDYLLKACELGPITTIVLDDMNNFLIHGDYDHQEYFREFSRVCRENNIDFICTLGVNSDKNEVYHKLPEIYARFSDIITVLK